MEKALKKLVDTMVLNKHGLSCDVVTYKYASNVTGYLFIVNFKVSQIYPLFEDHVDNLDYILREEDFLTDILESVRYVSVMPMDVYNGIFYRALDPENIEILNQSVKKTLDEVKEETGFECFSEVSCRYSTVYEETKTDLSILTAIEEFYGVGIRESYVGVRPYVNFVYTDGPCEVEIEGITQNSDKMTTPKFYQLMVNKNKSMDYMVPTKKGGGNVTHY